MSAQLLFLVLSAADISGQSAPVDAQAVVDSPAVESPAVAAPTVDSPTVAPTVAPAVDSPTVAPAVAAPAVAAPAPAVAEAEPAPIGVLRPAQIRWVQRRWSGVGVGYDNGLWGGQYGQSVKLSLPFGRKLGQFFGLRLRVGAVHYHDADNHYDPVLNLGGELFGRSPVWWGVLRVYGGGGVWAGIRPNPTAVGGDVALGGGGHFGVEAFAAPFMSFTFEVGGQAPGHSLGIDGGGSAMGGVMFYFGRNKTPWKKL